MSREPDDPRAPPAEPAGALLPPLSGVRVVVTRAAHQAGPTAEAFAAAGAEVALLPLLEVVAPDDPAPLDDALARLADFDWLALTSANAVAAVFGGGAGSGDDRPLLGGEDRLRLAVVGEATARALRRQGLEPDLVADDARAEGLAAALAPRVAGGTRVLLPQAADARDVLAERLAAAGARVERVAAYAKRRPPGALERAAEIFGPAGDFGWVAFTSPSTARTFAGLWGADWERRRHGLVAASIGPVTSAALVELGVEPAAEAATPGDDGLVEAVVAAVADRSLGRI